MMEKKGIPFVQFKLYCTSGYKYTGDVQDFGYVYWVTESVPISLPDDFPIVIKGKTTYVSVSKLKIIPYTQPPLFVPGEVQKNTTEYDNFKSFFTALLTAVNTLNSSYGIVKTFQSASKAPVILGTEYLVINKGGTIIRNLNRVRTTKGEIATKAGRKIFLAGIVLDAALVFAEKQTVKDALINTTMNGGILLIGEFCPPLGVILGVAYLLSSFGRPEDHLMSYEEIHGSIAPADNTRVHNPYKR